MSSPVKITRDLRVISPPNGPPLTGAQLLELGKQCLQKGSVAIALEGLTVTLGCRAPLPADQREVGTASGHDGAGHDGQYHQSSLRPCGGCMDVFPAWPNGRSDQADGATGH